MKFNPVPSLRELEFALVLSENILWRHLRFHLARRAWILLGLRRVYVEQFLFFALIRGERRLPTPQKRNAHLAETGKGRVHAGDLGAGLRASTR